MKKITTTFLCVIICLTLEGCVGGMTRGERLTKELGSEQEISDQIMEEIISELDARDADALKEQFSDSTKKKIQDLDKQIADLMDYCEGTSVSYKGNASTDTLTKYGSDVQKSFSGDYTLVTSGKTYRVAYEYRLIDKENPDKEGLSVLEFVTEETYQSAINSEEGYYQWQYPDSGAGVYIKE